MLIVRKCEWCNKRDAFVHNVKIKGQTEASVCIECYTIVEELRRREIVDNNQHVIRVSELSLAKAEEIAICKALECSKNKTAAALALGITRATLAAKTKKYGIKT